MNFKIDTKFNNYCLNSTDVNTNLSSYWENFDGMPTSNNFLSSVFIDSKPK